MHLTTEPPGDAKLGNGPPPGSSTTTTPNEQQHATPRSNMIHINAHNDEAPHEANNSAAVKHDVQMTRVQNAQFMTTEEDYEVVYEDPELDGTNQHIREMSFRNKGEPNSQTSTPMHEHQNKDDTNNVPQNYKKPTWLSRTQTRPEANGMLLMLIKFPNH